MPLRTVTLLAGLALAGGWFLGTVTGPTRLGPDGGSAQFGGPRPLGVERWQPPPPFKERLQKKLAHQPRSPQPKRNPFVFQAAPSRPASTERGNTGSVVEPTEPVPEVPRGPVFSLSGIAADEQDGITVFTAIVTDGSQLHLLEIGDTLPGGLTVVRVTESTVTLADETGGERTLRLR